jgi:protoporphyrinogen oxidase
LNPPADEITILGAGIAGLSASYHFGHHRCQIFERRPVPGGHTCSQQQFGFTFDEGPHVSFTRHDYVRDLFTRSTGGEVRDFPVRTRNYFRGQWIDHPAQSHLGQLAQPLRDQCYREMTSALHAPAPEAPPDNYRQWLDRAFGLTFAETFPAAYTRKYWTTDARNMSTDWLGPRLRRPTQQELDAGMQPGAIQAVHYISHVRYPQRGGYCAFLGELVRGARIHLGREVAAISLADQQIRFTDGSSYRYERLVSTLPLNAFVSCCHDAPHHVRDAAAALDCSQLLLVNVCAPETAAPEGHWFYVYDQDKASTRIHLTERLSPNNAPPGHTAIQVEVYFGRERPYPGDPDRIAAQVAAELVDMGFLDADALDQRRVQLFWRWVPHANVIFTHARRDALDTIFRWLEPYGLEREDHDLDPDTDWTAARPPRGRLMLAGRYAQWKYYWSDDCLLRGRQLAGVDR